MHRALGRAAGLLVVTSSLGMVSGVLAGPPLADQPAPVIAPSQASLEAMKVELAWTADLTTFGHPLEVTISGDTLEVRGSVPDESVHQQAVRLARQNSYLPVVDSISVTTPAGAKAPSSAEALHRLVTERLTRELGPRAAGFDVQVRADGQVSVRGSVGSMEDKVTVSRTLRSVPGCTSVVNALCVTPVQRSGQTITLISRDGSQAVRGPLPPSTIQPVGAVQEPAPAPAVAAPAAITLPPPPTLILPSGLPPAPAGVVGCAGGLCAGGNVIQPAGYADYYRAPAGYATPPVSPPVPVRPIGGYPPNDATMMAAPEEPRPRLWSRITAWRAQRKEKSATVEEVAPEPVKASQPAPVPPSMLPITPPSVRPVKPATWPPAYDNRSAPPAGTPAPPTAQPAPATPSQGQLKPTAAEQAAQGAQPAQGSRLAPVPAVAVDPAAPAGPVDANRLAKVVKAACGPQARKIQVVPLPDRTVRVHVQVAEPSAEKVLIDRLLQVPEVTAPGVRLEITVAP